MSREVPAEEFRDVLWSAVDRLRGSVDTAQYKELVLGLVFLRYLSDAFEARREELLQQLTGDWNPEDGLDELLETPAEYTGERVFWLPETARWSWITANARRDQAGEVLDAAMEAVMQANPSLAGVLPKVFDRAGISQGGLADLVALFDSTYFRLNSYEPDRNRLGEAYEHLLDAFARAEGKRGGEFHTPRSLVQLIVDMLGPIRSRVYDPACGAAGMLVQAAASQGTPPSVHGQEINERTWRLARMNLLIHGIDADLSDRWADTLAADRHPHLQADFVLAHPPFNTSDWSRDVSDPRWVYGVPPAGNANYAWLQHMISKLGPKGTAAVILANGSLHSRDKAEAEIRRALVEADLVSCIVALPPQLFSSTNIPACLWILDKDKASRRDQILFIDAHDMGELTRKTERVLTDADLADIAGTYRAWRGSGQPYTNRPEFCCSAPLEAVRDNDYALIPGLYVTPPPLPPNLMRDLHAVFDGYGFPPRSTAHSTADTTPSNESATTSAPDSSS
ncbi:class I SAM-dependent DNA methyltransferase [Streptomyces niveiscabiei]|uniref:type I restriction-modification system subunit M n=1 Tax=Streptomyces niveiscabiei TaxID=164115 RepID=UPI0029A13F90|nr:class I SAM-dependent DNA methyltransferase [Streptomyces niveiscabiei]MDX3385308.1 class I SAM-dependent DNA methyltransferase [Streptomyces niveiscabiei]